MKLFPDTSNCTGKSTWPALRALSLLAIAALQMPCASAADPVDDQLAKIGADEIGKNTVLATATLALGRKTYGENCVECHGRDLKGVDGRHAPDLSDRATLYGSDNVDAGPNQIFASDIEKTVRYGIRADHSKTRKLASMPSFARLDPKQEGGYPTLSEHQITDLAEYLASLQGQKHEVAAAARGKVLFGKDGGCFDCHGMDAKGDPSIGSTDLSSANYLYGNDRLSIEASIREGRKGTMPSYEGKLTSARIKAVAYYLFSVWERAQK
ncbi:MAG TPA: c-type cytochrome [Steroidobacteraceae bacterium]|jgi:cytochrome c oxidase cbb3-type subunit 3|nr:c-type cytochrome [Steroidobacteraceae bacterium]